MYVRDPAATKPTDLSLSVFVGDIAKAYVEAPSDGEQWKEAKMETSIAAAVDRSGSQSLGSVPQGARLPNVGSGGGGQTTSTRSA